MVLMLKVLKKGPGRQQDSVLHEEPAVHSLVNATREAVEQFGDWKHCTALHWGNVGKTVGCPPSAQFVDLNGSSLDTFEPAPLVRSLCSPLFFLETRMWLRRVWAVPS